MSKNTLITYKINIIILLNRGAHCDLYGSKIFNE